MKISVLSAVLSSFLLSFNAFAENLDNSSLGTSVEQTEEAGSWTLEEVNVWETEKLDIQSLILEGNSEIMQSGCYWKCVKWSSDGRRCLKRKKFCIAQFPEEDNLGLFNHKE